MKNFISLLIMFLLGAGCSNNFNVVPLSLKCNNIENPAGTDENPTFSWILESSTRDQGQSAYQIILDEKGKLKSENEAYWNSGKVSSGETSWIKYSGAALKPATRYFWRVRIWDRTGKPSEWSESASFITGLFKSGDWSNAKWIGYEEIPDSMLLFPGIHKGSKTEGDIAIKRSVVPYFRKEFTIGKKVKEAIIFICGLGHYELYLNGNRIGDRFLSPGWTNYHKTCLYNTFDVTEECKKGLNAIGVIAGNGFYNINRERYYKLAIAYGAPKIIFKLRIRYNDGTEDVVISDESWKTSPSPVTFSSIYGGEDYDASFEQTGWDKPGFDDGKWNQALPVREPGGVLKAEKDYPLRVLREFDPVRVFSPDSGIYIYDFGQNASGIIELKIKGNRDQQVQLSPAELLGPDSLIAQGASGAPYCFSYKLKDNKRVTWTPRFTYYGFRYVQVRGAMPNGYPNPENLPVITGLRMLHTRNSSPGVGEFRCSDELLNSIYNLIDWAVKSNLASVATDCPHREKLGWLEVTHLMGNSIKYAYDIHILFDKIIDDMIEAQLDNGLVPDIAPEYVQFLGGFRDSPEWGSACIILPWDLYEWYGDIEAVRKAYPMMKKYLCYLGIMANDNILSHGLGDWYDLGPNPPGVAQLTPKDLTATAIYFHDALLLSRMASLIDQKDDAAEYKSLAEAIRKSFNARFLDPITKVYSTGSQTAYSMPLYFGMTDDSIKSEVVNNLVKSINDNNNALTAGDVGYRYLLRTLEREGKSHLIYEMNSKTDVPGYGYQLSKGATALTESWAGLTYVSNNHMMLGHLMEWLYSGLGGIRQTDDSYGYKHILIKPEPVGDIRWTETRYRSVHGDISCSWKISGGNFDVKVKIPCGCRATVILPQPETARITESGNPLGTAEGIKHIESSYNQTSVEIGSGEYLFSCNL